MLSSTVSSPIRNVGAGHRVKPAFVVLPCLATGFPSERRGVSPPVEAMKSLKRLVCWLLFLLSGPASTGCGPSQAQPGPAPPPPPEVLVSLPVIRQVRDYVDFPGRMEAVNSIEIRARVT